MHGMNRRKFLGTAARLTGAYAVGTALGAGLATAMTSMHARVSDVSAWRARTRTAHGDIAYLAHGAGPAALFLHGFPLNSYQWRGAIELLAPHRRCIAPDF